MFQSGPTSFAAIHDWIGWTKAKGRATAELLPHMSRVRNVTALSWKISQSPIINFQSKRAIYLKKIAMATQSYITKVLEELGLVSLYKSPIDTKLLCTQRFVRLFAYGGSTLILVSYLRELGILYDKTGLFMTLTLVGDVLISFCLTLVADGLGRKTILSLGAALMTGSGVVFGLSGNYWVLLAASIFGVISPR
jgi:hypothetical protein